MASPDLLLAMQQMQMQQLAAMQGLGVLPTALPAGLPTMPAAAAMPAAAMAPAMPAAAPAQAAQEMVKMAKKMSMCKFFAAGTCNKGTNCSFAHSPEEIGQEVPVAAATGKVKTSMCKFFPFGTCNKGQSCPFAHVETEIGMPMPERPPPQNFVRAGDWTCECGNHNFASRIRCNSCSKLKEGKKEGDWMCSNCRTENDASFPTCMQCGSPKESANLTSKMEQMTASKGGGKNRSHPYGGKGGGAGGGACGGACGGECAGGCGGGCGGGWWDDWSSWGWGEAGADPWSAMGAAMAMMSGKGNGKGSEKGFSQSFQPSYQARAGDWTCECGNINFETRVKCNRFSCGRMKPGYAEGDWLCRKRAVLQLEFALLTVELTVERLKQGEFFKVCNIIQVDPSVPRFMPSSLAGATERAGENQIRRLVDMENFEGEISCNDGGGTGATEEAVGDYQIAKAIPLSTSMIVKKGLWKRQTQLPEPLAVEGPSSAEALEQAAKLRGHGGSTGLLAEVLGVSTEARKTWTERCAVHGKPELGCEMGRVFTCGMSQGRHPRPCMALPEDYTFQVTCGSDGPTCSWLFRESQALDFSKRPLVQQFCWAGLQRTGLFGGMLHTEAFNVRLAHLSCFAGMAFLLSACAVAESECKAPSKVESSTHGEDPALSFFMVAFRALGMVSHCLDASDWPMTLAEFSANFQLFVEHGCGFTWLRPARGLPFIRGVSGETLHDVVPWAKGVHNHHEVHMRINWALGAWDNRMYWEQKMRNMPGQLLSMKHQDPLDFCHLHPGSGELRMLILGTGPVAAERTFRCGELQGSVTSCDAFSRLYRRLAQETEFRPPHGIPEYCDVEELWQFYPRDYFHVVYVSNAMDHTVHPLRGLKMLLWVLRPEGKLMLRHFRNVHPEKWVTLSDGQHQWGFDVAGASGQESFLVWNHLHRWNVTEILDADGATTTAFFKEPFVEVEIRKTGSYKHSMHP
ncbi:unnamed protein product [Effrenium voratum]|uniref:Uncharacterized protein n=1 Tax=Effrenium voratum TaxID=2562239 RepID=A0AA36HZM4_9DINO|nr:unnamed protein product [Effrenium voratum]